MMKESSTALKVAAPKPGMRKIPKPEKVNPFVVIWDYIDTRFAGRFYRNILSKQIEANGIPLTETELNAVYVDLTNENKGDKVSSPQFYLFINSAHVRDYNPLEAFFDKAVKTTGHIAKLASALIQDREQNISSETRDLLLKKWIVGMVAGWFDENYNPLMLILTGPKNSGKTEFFRRLLPRELAPYFAESILRAGKDDEAIACENILVLVDEMDFLIRKDPAQIRRFTSANTFTYRPPYGRKNQKFKRYASFCGTSNESQVITDRANNRRIIPMCIERVDHDIYNSVDKVLLLFEAYNLYREGFKWQLSADDITLLESATEGNEVTTPEADLLIKHFEPGDEFMTATDILNILSWDNRLSLSPTRLGKALKEQGFKRVKKRLPGGRTPYGWLVKKTSVVDEFESFL